MNEHQAITRLKRGDIDGLEALVRLHQLRAIRTAYLITRDRALAEDVVQAAFMRVYERIHQFDNSRPFAPWFLRIVTNDAVKAAQRHERFVPLDTPSDAEHTLADLLSSNAAGPADAVEAAELHQAVWTALGELSVDQRAVVVRRYYLDMSETEMVDDLDVPHGTIKSRLRAARQRLRTMLQPWRTTDEDDAPRHNAALASNHQETTR